MADAGQILKRNSSLKATRTPFEPIWRECFDLTHPIRGTGFDSGVFDTGASLAKQGRILDSTSTDSADVLSSGMQSGLTPANSRWFEQDVDGATDDEKRWLSDAAESIWTNIHAANFDAAGFECMLDIVDAGWCVLYIDEDEERGGYHFEQWPLAQCYVWSSKRGGMVDGIQRVFQLTAEQAVNEFGNDCSEKTRDLARTKPDTMVDFIHEISPRSAYVVGGKLARNLPFASCHVEVGAKKIVRESGYHEFPCVVPRWRLIPNSAYGIGPVYTALPDIRTLNGIKRLEYENLDIAVAGMWIAEDDGVLNPKTIKVGGRKVIIANSVDSMKELKSGSDFNVTFTAEDRLQRSIRKILMADQLQPQDGPAMTATEVHVRMALVRQLMGPAYGRMQAEYLAPMVHRCFGIALRTPSQPLGQPPQSLINKNYHVRYLSPMARAAKLEDVTAIERYAAFAGQMALGGKPEALDLLSSDEAMRAVGEGLGVPQKVIPSMRAIELLREEKAKQQQQAQQQEQVQSTNQAMTDAMAQRVATAA